MGCTIISIISVACDFTTKSGGICEFRGMEMERWDENSRRSSSLCPRDFTRDAHQIRSTVMVLSLLALALALALMVQPSQRIKRINAS